MALAPNVQCLYALPVGDGEWRAKTRLARAAVGAARCVGGAGRAEALPAASVAQPALSRWGEGEGKRPVPGGVG